MTAPAPSGGSSPLRVGGLALLGVGAVAGLIGIASLVGGGDTTTTAAPPTGTPPSASAPAVTPAPGAPGAAPAPGAPGATPAPGSPGTAPAPGGVPVPSFGPTQNSAVSPSAPPAAGSGTAGRTVAKLPVRVYNNSKISGLAERAAADLRARGWTVASVGNYAQGQLAVTTVFYSGTADAESARALANAIGAKAEAGAPPGLSTARSELVLVVTREYSP